MGCRAQFWSIVGALALLWICGGMYLVLSGTSSVVSDKTTVQIQATMKAQGSSGDLDTTRAGQGLAALGVMGIGAPVVLCTGLPVLIVSALLANANRRGLREEKRHKEQLAAQQAQLATLQQGVMAQMAQAQMQAATMQSPQSPSLSGNPPPMSAAVKAQFEQASALIKAGRRDEARTLLQTIPHPKAAEWLAKLGKLSPPR